MLPSSSGLGHQLLKLGTGVRLPVGAQRGYEGGIKGEQVTTPPAFFVWLFFDLPSRQS